METLKQAFSCLLCFALILAFTACGPTTPTPAPQVVNLYASPSTQAWQAALFDCAAQQGLVLALSDPASADIVLRLGEPASLTTPAFQIGSEQVLVVVNPANPLGRLTEEQVTGLFSGRITDWSQIDPSKTGAAQVWVFAGGEDVQGVFEKTLAGSPVVSTARVATSPDEMSNAIASDQNAVGILSRRWKTGNVTEVFAISPAPVLAITPVEPVGAVGALIACLQQQSRD